MPSRSAMSTLECGVRNRQRTGSRTVLQLDVELGGCGETRGSRRRVKRPWSGPGSAR